MTEAARDPSAPRGGMTWRALFAEDGGDPLEAVKDAPPLAQAISQAAQKFPSACWGDVEDGCRDEVGKLLDLSVERVLFDGWMKLERFKKCVEESKAHPDDAFFQDLDDHKIASTHKPRIELRYGAVKVADLDFEIELALKVKGVRLEVRGGKVVCATAGVFAANAKLSLHDEVLVERATPELSAPAKIRFS
ncbi:hypothetical protein [Caulobacter sp. UNC279MFTsu5.1]|uniref:hypothetical protein n=1 Tax=Caulobacter sp. UNC279MFTsu5.1 TaxID=1502775 RepID=UPI0008EF1A7D|nr:hypothetical protein [Caulobacter sp. UNC279MFTsu5.1]SFJ07452.1 hypothetical protein SAMN02799626_01093 [Caulobacter sp. UNC279MFTsu5.1]